MPGGRRSPTRRSARCWSTIAAQVDGEPCCTHVGPDGAGHFVKMVHNGIEYADMQLIAEAYDLFRDLVGNHAGEIADMFPDGTPANTSAIWSAS